MAEAAAGHVARSDCERIRSGLVAQPVNTLSSLAYVAVAVPVWRAAQRAAPSVRGRWELVAECSVAAGLGSVAYHGPGGRLGRVVHDASLGALLGSLALAVADPTGGRRWPIGATAVAATGGTAGLAAVGAATTGAELVARPMPGRLLGAAGVSFVAGVACHALGRTGGPWCRPDSGWQAHAAWHLLSAAAVGLRAAGPRCSGRPAPE